MDRHHNEEGFMGQVARNITPIINELSTHIQGDYQQVRSTGVVDIFKLALAGEALPGEAEEKEEPPAPPAAPGGPRGPAILPVVAGKGEIAEAPRAAGPDAPHTKSPQEAQQVLGKTIARKAEFEANGEGKEASAVQVGPANPLVIPQVAIPIPLVAKGYEAIYQRFLNGVLIYRPQPGNDAGRIDMRIHDLANPLEGTFDLSRCGCADKESSISTGYRKRVNPANAGKVEIWIAPRFLIEKELATTAGYFKTIAGNWWAATATIGIFWNSGSWAEMSCYDYLTSQDPDNISNNNLYEKWKVSKRTWSMHWNMIDFGWHNCTPEFEKISICF
jgi:hypothetical protein